MQRITSSTLHYIEVDHSCVDNSLNSTVKQEIILFRDGYNLCSAEYNGRTAWRCSCVGWTLTQVRLPEFPERDFCWLVF